MKKTVVITGASSGIGRALALEYARRGFNLGLTGRRMDRLEALQAEIRQLPEARDSRIEVIALDVDDHARVNPTLQELFSRFERIDTVVVNAGVNQLTAVGKGQLDRELAIMNTNLLGAIATVDAAVAHFRITGGGHVAGISSLASLNAIPRQAAYCATKAGFSMYLDCAAIELRRNNITFTRILPGFVQTEIVDNMEKYPFVVSAEQAAREIAEHIEKRHAEGVVPAYPWKLLKPLLTRMPDFVWKYMK